MPTGYRDQEVGCLKCPKMPDSCTGIKVKYLNYYNVALGQSCTYINEKMFRPRIHYGSHNLIPRPAGPPSPSPLADQFTYLTRAAVSTGGALIQYKVVFFFFFGTSVHRNGPSTGIWRTSTQPTGPCSPPLAAGLSGKAQ